MRDVVRKAFVPLTISLEGGPTINWMFPDVKGLVSTGYGLLLDPVGMALALPWRRADGTMASRDEIVADWANVKNYPDAPRLGHRSVEKIAKLRLDREGLDAAFNGKLSLNEQILRLGFGDWEDWCADAQLGTLSMCWAVGARFWDIKAGRAHWPKLTAALKRRDYHTAAIECFLPEEKTISGLRPRNVANKALFLNAAAVEMSGQVLPNLKPDVLYYPLSVAPSKASDAEETWPGRDQPDFDTVHVLPDTASRCRYCGLTSCSGDCLPPAA